MRASRIDANQPDIVAALRRLGVAVQCLHTVGAGVPDLLCSVNNCNVLIEIKDGSKAPSAQKLTPDQVAWHANWKTIVHVVNSVDQAIEVVRQYRNETRNKIG